VKVIFLTGSHPRHLHIAKRLYEEGFLKGLLVENREEFVPSSPAGLSEQDQTNFVRHFQDRMVAEQKTFQSIGTEQFTKIPVLSVSTEKLNSENTKQWIQSLNPDVVISYGVHKLEKNVLDILPQYAWNIHGGLSPWYRGSITLFWPFYFLKPNWAGMTIHQLTARLDGGSIIHHSCPELARGDGIHDVACKAVVQAGEDLIRILSKLKQGGTVNPVPQKSSGKLFNSTDWAPQHLRLIYNTFNNDIVDRYLDGELGHQEPPLIKAF
jgi:folate-dependent phosphoribosylglycinamide formyltransferase PurN